MAGGNLVIVVLSDEDKNPEDVIPVAPVNIKKCKFFKFKGL